MHSLITSYITDINNSKYEEKYSKYGFEIQLSDFVKRQVFFATKEEKNKWLSKFKIAN